MSQKNELSYKKRESIGWIAPESNEDFIWIEHKSSINKGPYRTSHLRAMVLEKEVIEALDRGPESYIAFVEARLREELQFWQDEWENEDLHSEFYWRNRYDVLCEHLALLGHFFTAKYSNMEGALPPHKEFIPTDIFQAYERILILTQSAKEKLDLINQGNPQPQKGAKKGKDKNQPESTPREYSLTLKVTQSPDSWIKLHGSESGLVSTYTSLLEDVKSRDFSNENLRKDAVVLIETLCKYLNLYIACNATILNLQASPFLSDEFLVLYQDLKTWHQKLRKQQDSFQWPSTEAPPANEEDDLDWTEKVPQVGLLKHMDYKVGMSGLRKADRQKILKEIFEEKLPMVNNPSYMAEWGDPRSSSRLKKMANSLATFCKKLKWKVETTGYDYNEAIFDYEDDLDWLYHTYYKGRFDFPWPETYQEDYD